MYRKVYRELISSPNRRYFCVKRRKYPINPEDSKSLPVFDYGTSNKHYQRVFVCGNIHTGALGIPYMKRGESIEKIEAIKAPRRLGFAEKFSVTTAACGFGFSAFAVHSDEANKKLYGTGLNTDSQIGYHAIREGHPLEIIFFPQSIPLPFKSPSTQIKKLAAGRAHLVVLSEEGLFIMGNNSYGQCGREIIQDENYFMSNYINVVPKIEDKKIVDIECGQDHTFAITEDGSVYSCGWGADGQTGLGTFSNAPEFRKVQGDISGEKIVKISSRSDFVLALNDKGQVFGWGNAEYDQIPTKNNEQQVCTPTYLKMLENHPRIVDVAAGGSFCLVLNDQGEVYVWGFGILGVGPRVSQSARPLKIPETLFGKNDYQPDCKVVKLKCGLSYAIAVTNLGDAFAWGRNMNCCLGLGNDKDQFFPFKVSMGGIASEVSCGVDHTIVICKPFI